jgi:hypothetical protein
MFAACPLLWIATAYIFTRGSSPLGHAPRLPFRFLDAPRWSFFHAWHAEDYWAYREAGPMTYAQMQQIRARGWNAATIEDAIYARNVRLASEARRIVYSTTVTLTSYSVRSVITALTVEAFTAFTQARCPMWDLDPKQAQAWFDAFGGRAIPLINAGLTLPEAVALDADGRLDDGAVAMLGALRADIAA